MLHIHVYMGLISKILTVQLQSDLGLLLQSPQHRKLIESIERHRIITLFFYHNELNICLTPSII